MRNKIVYVLATTLANAGPIILARIRAVQLLDKRQYYLRIWLALTAVIACFGFVIDAEAQETKILVSYTWIEKEISPRQEEARADYQAVYTLMPGGKVAISVPGGSPWKNPVQKIGQTFHAPDVSGLS